MQLQDILFSQGFGTRRVCAGLVQQGFVAVAGSVCQDAAAVFEAEGLAFQVQGEPWLYHAKAYLMLHKPSGYECSQKPSTYPSIYTLLPAPVRQRGGGAAAAGGQRRVASRHHRGGAAMSEPLRILIWSDFL